MVVAIRIAIVSALNRAVDRFKRMRSTIVSKVPVREPYPLWWSRRRRCQPCAHEGLAFSYRGDRMIFRAPLLVFEYDFVGHCRALDFNHSAALHAHKRLHKSGQGRDPRTAGLFLGLHHIGECGSEEQQLGRKLEAAGYRPETIRPTETRIPPRDAAGEQWCPRSESNRHSLRNSILSRARVE